MQVIVTGVRSVRAGGLIAEASIRFGPIEVAGARLIDHDGRRSLALPKTSDRRHHFRIHDRDVMARAVDAVERALAAIEAANGGGDG